VIGKGGSPQRYLGPGQEPSSAAPAEEAAPAQVQANLDTERGGVTRLVPAGLADPAARVRIALTPATLSGSPWTPAAVLPGISAGRKIC
jgi:hypothetical protein